jgi:nucleoside-diphosphate-sugar epimerase
LKNINIFCFGFGKVAKNFISKIKSENYNINLSTTSRSVTSKKIFNGVNYQNYLFDNMEYDKNLIIKLREADHILVSIPPVEGEDLVIKNFSKFLDNLKVKWITYLSATSVYGDHEGQWVDENSETKPTSLNGMARLKSENFWLSLKINKNLPVQIFRLSGIYSNESNILIRLTLGTAKLIKKKDHYFSRIHVEDIANILFKSLSKFKSGEIYNISDDKPSPSQEVVLYGSKILNIHNFKIVDYNEIENEMLKNFYKDSKKVSNKKIKNLFSYKLKFPTYIEGLNYIRNNFIKL